MQTTRRDLFKTGLATAAAAALPASAAIPRHTHRTLSATELEANYTKLNAELARPVFRRELFPNPVVLDSIELLHYKNSWLCRVRSTNGAEGISISNAQQMKSLYPIFVDRVAPFFLGQDVRDLERLLDLSMVYQSNYKATGLAVFVPLATLEFAILDLFGKMSNRSIGLLISDKIHNPKIAVYQANGERYISPEETIAHLKRDVAISHAKAIKFKLGGRMSHIETPPDRSARLIPMVRETFGDQMVISADANGSYTPEEAIPIGKLMQQYKYAFYEEPVPFDNYDGLQQVADALEIPIALGEQEPSTWNFRHVLAHNAVGIVQQDMFYFGGMCRCMKVARMAAVLNKQCIPHISSTGLGYLYMMHFVSAITNSGPYHEFKEFNNDLPYKCATSTLRSNADGVITVPTGPGVGVEIDPDYIKKHEVMKVIKPANFKDAE
ncbi:mandelate racemase/muconate lactonizing enzyme family protein [Granulicella sp. 5B5]|uniref:mandelate racemase/muconate lactonizing enzyme family protein n=1 Tax=Granulicella sp. 5B5 TaxID=1617967 RepID=UPI0015F43AD1|nr:mandelate racemase/muconate lactonizing enzyme family protein [Granulicella sp. 5B5]QMV17930.1 mandelate racemase/muconate lactonizing enzyme family protein [Granulicella sp. 5B5]